MSDMNAALLQASRMYILQQLLKQVGITRAQSVVRRMECVTMRRLLKRGLDEAAEFPPCGVLSRRQSIDDDTRHDASVDRSARRLSVGLSVCLSIHDLSISDDDERGGSGGRQRGGGLTSSQFAVERTVTQSGQNETDGLCRTNGVNYVSLGRPSKYYTTTINLTYNCLCTTAAKA